MKTSIVILNWNTLPYLRECVDSIRKYTKDYELIIVDNGSGRYDQDYIKLNADKYTLNKDNKGFAGGNNQGARIADGELICFMNSDVTVGRKWLKRMKKTLASHKDCGAAGPLGNPRFAIISGDGYSLSQYKGQYKKDTEVKMLAGYCVLMKTGVFKKIWWDESFHPGCFEDNVLSKNLHDMGYSLWISAKANVNHLQPGRSFEANGLNYEKVMKRNREVYKRMVGR